MIILAVDSIGAASSGKKETEISSTFLIEEVSSCISDIKLRITSGKCGLLFLLVFSTDELGVPKVVLFISFFIGVVVGQ